MPHQSCVEAEGALSMFFLSAFLGLWTGAGTHTTKLWGPSILQISESTYPTAQPNGNLSRVSPTQPIFFIQLMESR